MPRLVSVIVLLALVVVLGALFFRVMADFLVPVFLAALVAVLLQPVQRWMVARCGGRVSVAAGLTTTLLLLVVLIPFAMLLTRATAEGIRLVRSQKSLGPDDWNVEKLVEQVNNRFGLHISAEDVAEAKKTLWSRANEWVTSRISTTAAFFGELLLGLAVMTVSLYYFLVDGENMIVSVGRLLPLDLGYQRQLLDKFAQMSRAVSAATLLSAAVQTILASMGYLFVQLDSVFLWTLLTFVAAMVPFLGAAIVWAPAALWLYFGAERHTAAILLAIWGFGAVSMVDNFIKPLVLQGQAKLHPLLAFLSVLGGVQALGPIGIFVGPMSVAFLQAGLKMLSVELDALKQTAPAMAATVPPPPAPPG